MNNSTISTGATLIGGAALQPNVADCLADVAAKFATFHSQSWAAVVLAIAGVVLHARAAAAAPKA